MFDDETFCKSGPCCEMVSADSSEECPCRRATSTCVKVCSQVLFDTDVVDCAVCMMCFAGGWHIAWVVGPSSVRFGGEWNVPEAVCLVAESFDDHLSMFIYFEIVLVEDGNAVVVA